MMSWINEMLTKKFDKAVFIINCCYVVMYKAQHKFYIHYREKKTARYFKKTINEIKFWWTAGYQQ